MKTIKFICALVVLLSTGSVHANKFGVRVLSESGEPEPGVAVCIGTHGDYKQFGAHITSRKGDVYIDVPNVPLVVTISKNRFTGVRMTEPARYFNLLKEVRLVEGVPGPRCRADTSLADAPGHELFIAGVLVAKADRTISLTPTVDGQPTHYRVSADREFAGAQWRSYEPTFELTDRLAARAEIYLQVRKYSTANDAWLEARSQVLTVSLPQS